jgi:hypothetical protein
MEQVLDSLRKIIQRWVTTESVLTSDAENGDVVFNVKSSTRFVVGDELLLTDGVEYEYPFIVIAKPDNESIEVDRPVSQGIWRVSKGSKVSKSMRGRLVQGIYMGDPPVIPRYPAVVVNGRSKSSEWATLETTLETYDIDISCYIQDDTQEDGYRSLLYLAKTIETGLKRNLFPLVGERSHSDIVSGVERNDTIINVDSTDGIVRHQFILIEDRFKAEDVRVDEIIDSTHLRLKTGVANSYPIQYDPRIIIVDRFLHNTWPKSVDFGFVSKDTLLKAAKISWKGEELEAQGAIGWKDTPRT